jgi:EmrB/QacA subfamily drug resistance transporter
MRFGIGLLALGWWVWVELTDEHPLLDLRLFAIPVYALSTLITFVLTVGMFGGMLLLPLFLQNIRGLGAAETGLILISQVLPMMVAMPLIGRLVDKVGARPIILVGLPFLALATWQMSALDVNTSDMTLRLWLAARGCAMGFVMMPSMTAGLNAIPLAQMSRGSSMSNVMRQVFGAFGTAIVVTILQQRQAFHTAMLSQLVTPDNIPLQQLLSSTQAWALGHGMSAAQAQVMGLMVVARQVATTAAVMSYDDVFRITAAVTLLAFLPAMFLKTTRTKHGGGPSVLVD